MMKNLILIIMAIFSFNNSNAQNSIYDIAINDISGNPIDLNEFKGKHVLFVNVADVLFITIVSLADSAGNVILRFALNAPATKVYL